MPEEFMTAKDALFLITSFGATILLLATLSAFMEGVAYGQFSEFCVALKHLLPRAMLVLWPAVSISFMVALWLMFVIYHSIY